MKKNIVRVMESSSKYCYDISKIIFAVAIIQPIFSGVIDYGLTTAGVLTCWSFWMAGATIDMKIGNMEETP